MKHSVEKLHTTFLGAARIKKNLSLETEDVVRWCQAFVQSPNVTVTQRGKNWYVEDATTILTINRHSYTIITAHKKTKKPRG